MTTINEVKRASEGWTENQCSDVLIGASRLKTLLGTLSNMMTKLPSCIINREELYHAIKIEEARIKYAKLRWHDIVNTLEAACSVEKEIDSFSLTEDF